MGFVKLPNELKNWAWYGDNNTLAVYVRLLLGAVWADTDYKNIHLTRGQIATTIPMIAEQSGLSERQTRTALDRLKSTGKVTVKITNKFSIITLLEYDCNAENDRQNDSQMTGKRQASDSPTLYNTEIQNIRNPENTRAEARGGGGDNSILDNFEKFWNAYPKKTAKQNALKVWQKLKPDEELTGAVLSALERFKKTEQWQRDDGRYIPYPATWLNGRRWEDDIQEPKAVEIRPRQKSWSDYTPEELEAMAESLYE